MSGIVVLALRFLLSACLYAFLGWALFSLWSELRAQGFKLAGRRAPALDLIIQPRSSGNTHRVFQQTEILVGRDPACDITLNDETVSARHVHFSFHHGQWWVEDLNSMNGTRLNQVQLNTPTVITTGDQIECGHTAIFVSVGLTADPSPTKRL